MALHKKLLKFFPLNIGAVLGKKKSGKKKKKATEEGAANLADKVQTGRKGRLGKRV